MNYKMIFNTTGKIIFAEGLLMILPLICCLCYAEFSIIPSFIIPIAAALILGGLAFVFIKPKDRVIFAREGFIIVALSWISMSLIGCLPFIISQSIPSFVDAFFETTSGFTTTGATILSDVEHLSRGILFWRSFTHWIGGMGILVLTLAVIPSKEDRSIHILRAEMPGPVKGKLVPKLRQSAMILYMIYIALTLLEVIFLLFGGMDLFESLVHALGTAGTGGFGIRNDSIASYNSYIQWVITAFMFLFGINFNIYFMLITTRKIKNLLHQEEMWVYISIIVVTSFIISLYIYPQIGNVGDTIRVSAFQVTSILTTAGFTTVDFDLWQSAPRIILLLLMFVGASSGSTGGGLKISRLIIIFKDIKAQLKKSIHPNYVKTVRLDGKPVDKTTTSAVNHYFVLYIFIFAFMLLILCFEPNNFGEYNKFETIFSGLVSCFNNIGPALGGLGPTMNYAGFSWWNKILLSFAMLLGRLEIYPILFCLIPASWTRTRKI